MIVLKFNFVFNFLFTLTLSAKYNKIAKTNVVQAIISIFLRYDIKFVWIGGTERGDPHYFRVQGASFLIEYDNTQNNANHIHLVWRDFAGDFGRDLIRMHYQAAASVYGSIHNHK